MKIAVDAMGGDNAPEVVVQGALKAAQEFSDVQIMLFGNQSQINQYIKDQPANIEIIHTTEKIESEDDPIKAVRRKKNSSMVLAANAVKEGQADALISAGNTGALLTAGLLIIGRIKGIDRPGLMSTLPSTSKDVSGIDMLDLGANADTKPKNIDQFAVLGSYYAKAVRGIQNPKVALLNNGTEENKGSELTKEAFRLLSENDQINFYGNIEARDILDSQVDVIVADGFTGNAVLKSMEGTASVLVEAIKKSIMEGSFSTKIGGSLIKNSLSSLRDQFDYSKQGGAFLAGVKAPLIKTHGSADAEAVYSTIRQARTIIETGVIEDLVAYFENLKREENG